MQSKLYEWWNIKKPLNEDTAFFKDLFTPDTNFKGCDICMMDSNYPRARKNHMFLLHYNQTGGNRRNQQLPINVLKRGPIKYFSINFNWYKDFYDFFQERIEDDFFDAVYNRFVSNGQYKVEGYAEIINQQHGDFIIAESLANKYLYCLSF